MEVEPPAFQACAVDLVLKVEDLVGYVRDLRTDHCSEGIGDVQFQCENGKGIRERDHSDSCVIRSGVNAADA